MRFRCIFAVLFLPSIAAQCPRTADLSPCKCTDDDQRSRLSCWGNLWLPRLTVILRKEMCGRTIDRFELLESNITYLPSNLFLKMPVKDINIYSVNIDHFTQAGSSAFHGLQDILQSLSMRRCSLVDALEWQMIGRMRALTYLDLSYNNLTRIPPQWFRRPPSNLRSLVLKGNRIATLETGATTFMYKLVELDLSENRIASLERNALPNPGNSLIFLRLSYNQLQTLPRNLFNEMIGIRRIYLDNNRIRTLEKSTWSPVWGDLDTLDLYGNDLVCDCHMMWVSELWPPRRLYGECASPVNFTSVPLKNLHVDSFEFCHDS